MTHQQAYAFLTHPSLCWHCGLTACTCDAPLPTPAWAKPALAALSCHHNLPTCECGDSAWLHHDEVGVCLTHGCACPEFRVAS